ncbi:RNA deprotection pyrophosphohydrolase [Mesobacillus zeae]|uniref:Nucleoside triphosphatase YtkD n=1 Tax=Mesobacillus zeae TaxID=1917180 RepID=A0A398AZL0_9BACI|nr:nucleoside triphosphatase YtkD [Mesobacillus zeae]RID83037.1 nucleoside triphosphatase YtkD [Mesobacillus zeae]
MKQFKDHEGKDIRFSFEKDSFGSEPGHVLVICRSGGNWLFTAHSERGLEFPGGKKEKGETPEEAAVREVREETGAIVKELKFIAEYEVTGPSGNFVKRVFYADINEFLPQSHYFETKGPVFAKVDLLKERFGAEYSFIMKDDVMKWVLEYLGETS